jgi:hypothetical protein
LGADQGEDRVSDWIWIDCLILRDVERCVPRYDGVGAEGYTDDRSYFGRREGDGKDVGTENDVIRLKANLDALRH